MAARTTREELNKSIQKVIDLSSGDPHRAGIVPITFVRQVLAVCVYPELLQDDSLPLDVRHRAQQLLGTCSGGSVGAYSADNTGILYMKQKIADFISKRDGGVTVDLNNIFYSGGTQKNSMIVFNLLSKEEGGIPTGILTAKPYPHTLPSLLQAYRLTLVPFRLLEDQGWTVDIDEMYRALSASKGYCKPRAIFICNPGIPTGHVQDRHTIEKVIQFAANEGLVLLVQEDCVFGHGVEFVSYKKVLFEMGQKYSDHVELISFNSLSNGTLGECGMRGGYMEVINMDPAVQQRIVILKSLSGPPVIPQLATEIMVNPPAHGDPSYQTYKQEISIIQSTLSCNAQRACEVFNSLKGVSCQPAMGGVFLYPRLELPAKMIQEATMLGLSADVFYCQMLLNKEGLSLGPGSENRPDNKTYYLRLSFAAAPDSFQDALSRLCSFHQHLLKKYS